MTKRSVPKRAKAQLFSEKLKANHQAQMVRVKNVELERHVEQLNAYRRRNACLIEK
jgi:hypothetical protein